MARSLEEGLSSPGLMTCGSPSPETPDPTHWVNPEAICPPVHLAGIFYGAVASCVGTEHPLRIQLHTGVGDGESCLLLLTLFLLLTEQCLTGTGPLLSKC